METRDFPCLNILCVITAVIVPIIAVCTFHQCQVLSEDAQGKCLFYQEFIISYNSQVSDCQQQLL